MMVYVIQIHGNHSRYTSNSLTLWKGNPCYMTHEIISNGISKKWMNRIKLPKQKNPCVTRALRIRCIDSAATRTYYTLNSTSFHIYWYYWDVMWFSCVWSGNAIDMYVRIYTWHMIPRLRLTHHSDLYVVGELNMKSEFVVIVFRILNVSFNFQVSITAVNTLTQ